MGKRIVLLHWHKEEAAERSQRLQDSGYDVTCVTKAGAGDFQDLRNNPPQAFIIDLARIPSHGRDMALWIRQQKATRQVPIVFLAGDSEKTQKIKELLPDATFSDWSRLGEDLVQAMTHPPEHPVVPGTFAGYHDASLPKKLGITIGARVALLHAPTDFEQTLGDLPANVRVQRDDGNNAEIVLLFVRSQEELPHYFEQVQADLPERGKVWLVWPKKTSGVHSDLSEKNVRAFGLKAGLVDFKISSIDATWSGLCFSRRRQA